MVCCCWPWRCCSFVRPIRWRGWSLACARLACLCSGSGEHTTSCSACARGCRPVSAFCRLSSHGQRALAWAWACMAVQALLGLTGQRASGRCPRRHKGADWPHRNVILPPPLASARAHALDHPMCTCAPLCVQCTCQALRIRLLAQVCMCRASMRTALRRVDSAIAGRSRTAPCTHRVPASMALHAITSASVDAICVQSPVKTGPSGHSVWPCRVRRHCIALPVSSLPCPASARALLPRPRSWSADPWATTAVKAATQTPCQRVPTRRGITCQSMHMAVTVSCYRM